MRYDFIIHARLILAVTHTHICMTVVIYCTNVCSDDFALIKMMSYRLMQVLLFLAVSIDNSQKNDPLLDYSCQDMDRKLQLRSINHLIEGYSRTIFCCPSSTNIQGKTTADINDSNDVNRSSNDKDISNRIVSISNIVIFLMPLFLVLLL